MSCSPPQHVTHAAASGVHAAGDASSPEAELTMLVVSFKMTQGKPQCRAYDEYFRFNPDSITTSHQKRTVAAVGSWSSACCCSLTRHARRHIVVLAVHTDNRLARRRMFVPFSLSLLQPLTQKERKRWGKCIRSTNPCLHVKGKSKSQCQLHRSTYKA